METPKAFNVIIKTLFRSFNPPESERTHEQECRRHCRLTWCSLLTVYGHIRDA